MKSLPEIATDTDGLEKAAGKSIDVLVKVKGFKHPMPGNYWHYPKKWSAKQIHSNDGVDAEEWWHMPEIGTGNKP